MSQIATFTEFYNYWAAVAADHVDITGFKFGDRDVVKSAARSNMSQCELWVQSYETVNMLDNYSDNHIGNIEGSLVIMKVKPESWAGHRTVYEECETIVKQIISKIFKEFQEGTLQAQLNRFKYGEADMVHGATPMLGCRLDFSFLRPERLVYDSLKWEHLEFVSATFNE